MTLSTDPESEIGKKGSVGKAGAAWAPAHLPSPTTLLSLPTSSQEDDIIGPILCLHTVYYDLAQLLGQVGFDKDRAAPLRPHGPEHEWVGSGKLQHLIRVVLGAAKGSPRLRSHLAGALWQRQREHLESWDHTFLPSLFHAPLSGHANLGGLLSPARGSLTRSGLPATPHLTPLQSPKEFHADTMRRASGISVLPSPLAWPDTHYARAGEGHLAPVGPPLVLRTILVGKGPLEDLPDVLHVVQADCKALEHSTAKGRQGQSGQGGRQRGRRWPGSVGRAEGNSACSQQKPKNKNTRAEVARGKQKIQPVTMSGTETGTHGEAGI